MIYQINPSGKIRFYAWFKKKKVFQLSLFINNLIFSIYIYILPLYFC